jgi:hypothetical protein
MTRILGLLVTRSEEGYPMLVLLEEAGSPVATSASPWSRLMARARASRLDSDLAGGALPDATVALVLRAQTLIAPRTRREVAKGAQRLLATAMLAPATGDPQEPAAGEPRMPAARQLRIASTRPLRVPVCADRVRESAEELSDLIRRLLADSPVAARGVALASELLSDGSGPLYHRANADDARARVREALDALDPLNQAAVG